MFFIITWNVMKEYEFLRRLYLFPVYVDKTHQPFL